MPVIAVAKENHRAVRNEIFHKYLNKVQQLHATNKSSLQEWRLGTKFAVYSWNASPVDGTDIERSVAAIGRSFPFPVDIAQAPAGLNEGGDEHNLLEHVLAWCPLLERQRQIFNILVQGRRKEHRDRKNASRKAKTFERNDLVIVTKQVKSNAREGVSAKLILKAWGPYRVLGKADLSGSSYRVQRLPFCRGLGRAGVVTKENVALMKLIPSTLVLHRRTDGADSRLATMRTPFTASPLEQQLGAVSAG